MPPRPITPRVGLALTLLLPMAVLAQPESGLPKPPQPTVVPVEVPVADLLLGQALPTAAQQPIHDEHALRPGQPLKLRYPLLAAASEVAPFGWRYSESRQAWRLHTGADLITEAGQPVLAVLPGRVVLVRELEGYGLTVLIDHGRGWQSLYAHLMEASVLAGTAVRAGDAIGRVGQSGRATTPHLHVELRRQTAGGTLALDPGVLLNPLHPQP